MQTTRVTRDDRSMSVHGLNIDVCKVKLYILCHQSMPTCGVRGMNLAESYTINLVKAGHDQMNHRLTMVMRNTDIVTDIHVHILPSRWK